MPPDADTTLAREYDLEISSQFVPLGVYTLEVDYTNIDVQVKGEINGRDRYAMGGPSGVRRQRRLSHTLHAITTVLLFWKMLRSAGFTLTLHIRAINTTGTLFKMLHLSLSGSGANARDRRTHGRAAARLGTPRLVAVLVRRVGRQRHEVQVRRLAATVDAPCSASLFRLTLGEPYTVVDSIRCCCPAFGLRSCIAHFFNRTAFQCLTLSSSSVICIFNFVYAKIHRP